MLILTEKYSEFLNQIALVVDDLVDNLVLDKEARQEVFSEYYTQEDVEVYEFNKNLSRSIDKSENKMYSSLDESILPDNFFNE